MIRQRLLKQCCNWTNPEPYAQNQHPWYQLVNKGMITAAVAYNIKKMNVAAYGLKLTFNVS